MSMSTTRQGPFSPRGRPGFTLAELLVSIFIFGLLTTLVIANFHGGNYDQELRRAAEQLASNLRRMQNLSMSGYVYTPGGNGFSGTPPGGYGMYMNSRYGLATTQYSLFADFTRHDVSSQPCLSGAGHENHLYDSGVNCDPLVEAQTVVFQSNVYLSNICAAGHQLDTSPANTNNHGYHIVFVPPNALPVVSVVDQDPTIDVQVGSGVILELYHTVTHKKRIVTLTGSAGQISESLGEIDATTCTALTGGR